VPFLKALTKPKWKALLGVKVENLGSAITCPKKYLVVTFPLYFT